MEKSTSRTVIFSLVKILWLCCNFSIATELFCRIKSKGSDGISRPTAAAIDLTLNQQAGQLGIAAKIPVSIALIIEHIGPVNIEGLGGAQGIVGTGRALQLC